MQVGESLVQERVLKGLSWSVRSVVKRLLYSTSDKSPEVHHAKDKGNNIEDQRWDAYAEHALGSELQCVGGD